MRITPLTGTLCFTGGVTKAEVAPPEYVVCPVVSWMEYHVHKALNALRGSVGITGPPGPVQLISSRYARLVRAFALVEV